MEKFKVLRQHDGDKQYWEGDERELSASDAKHLVELGVLEPKAKAKTEKPLENKMEKAPANKAVRTSSAKKD